MLVFQRSIKSFLLELWSKTKNIIIYFCQKPFLFARWRFPTLRCQILRTFFFFCEDLGVEHFGPLQQWRQNWMIWAPEIKCQKCQNFSPPAHKEDFWHCSVSAWFWLIDILCSSGVVWCDIRMPVNQEVSLRTFSMIDVQCQSRKGLSGLFRFPKWSVAPKKAPVLLQWNSTWHLTFIQAFQHESGSTWRF